MQTEYEIKVLDIDVANAVRKLKAAGFKKQASMDYRRYVYDLSREGEWLRLRTDGSKTTLTYKNFVADSIDGVQELEVVVGNFEKTHELLQLMGLKARQYQENNRELYKRDDIEIAIDSWPLIPPYLEVEGKNTDSVTACIVELGFQGKKTSSKPTSDIYKLYGLDLDSYEHLSFET